MTTKTSYCGIQLVLTYQGHSFTPACVCHLKVSSVCVAMAVGFSHEHFDILLLKLSRPEKE